MSKKTDTISVQHDYLACHPGKLLTTSAQFPLCARYTQEHSEVGKLDHTSERHLRVIAGCYFPRFLIRDVNNIMFTMGIVGLKVYISKNSNRFRYGRWARSPQYSFR